MAYGDYSKNKREQSSLHKEFTMADSAAKVSRPEIDRQIAEYRHQSGTAAVAEKKLDQEERRRRKALEDRANEERAGSQLAAAKSGDDYVEVAPGVRLKAMDATKLGFAKPQRAASAQGLVASNKGSEEKQKAEQVGDVPAKPVSAPGPTTSARREAKAPATGGPATVISKDDSAAKARERKRLAFGAKDEADLQRMEDMVDAHDKLPRGRAKEALDLHYASQSHLDRKMTAEQRKQAALNRARSSKLGWMRDPATAKLAMKKNQNAVASR